MKVGWLDAKRQAFTLGNELCATLQFECLYKNEPHVMKHMGPVWLLSPALIYHMGSSARHFEFSLVPDHVAYSFLKNHPQTWYYNHSNRYGNYYSKYRISIQQGNYRWYFTHADLMAVIITGCRPWTPSVGTFFSTVNLSKKSAKMGKKRHKMNPLPDDF